MGSLRIARSDRDRGGARIDERGRNRLSRAPGAEQQHAPDRDLDRADGAPTALVEAALAAGCNPVVDGVEVLVRQGASAFERWTGASAPVEVMRAALRPIVLSR